MNLIPQQLWHAISAERALAALETDASGLSFAEAQKRMEKLSLNEISSSNGDSALSVLTRQFKSPLILILVLASGVSLLLGDLIDSAIIAGIVVINALVGFAQEIKVSRILAKLGSELEYTAVVMRGGELHTIKSRDVVEGDILMLRQGSKVSADARIIDSSNLRTNEVILTGESMPVEKSRETTSEDMPVSDRKNMLFLGTLIEEGTARAVVTATGKNTEFGKIAETVERERRTDQTPLQRQLGSLAKILGIIFVLLAAMLFVAGISTGLDVLTMFLTATAVAVAAVPESLPVALSVVLAVGSRRILAKGGLVRKMSAAEALGNVSVIATDKTATLTEGKLQAVELVSSDGVSYGSDDFRSAYADEASPGRRMLKALSLSSNAFVENPNDEREKWVVNGNPIDKAIFLSVTGADIDREGLEREHPRIDELPFDARFKYAVVLNKYSDGNIAAMLGAPETLLELSSADDKVRSEMEKSVERLAKKGFRVLGLSERRINSQKLEREQMGDFDFLGLVAFSDPIRPDVAQVVEQTKQAGIRTVVVTGDHALTAEYIASEAGILTGPGRVIEGRNLPDNLEEVIMDYDVYARVAPEDKVHIVKALQAHGERVAMIGDGVNDAPALLRSDIGVAVGSGTDVAREASDLVLLKDNFRIIVEAVRQGRIILDNIRKAAIFLLSDGFSEIVLISGSIILGLPLALLPAQILWVNLLEDVLPAIALAFERETTSVMKRHPSHHAKLFPRQMKWLIVMFAVITDIALLSVFVWLLSHGDSIIHARTMMFIGLGVTSLLYVFSVRSLDRPIWHINPFSNHWLTASIFLGFLLYGVALYVPVVRDILEVTPLHGSDWGFIGALCLLNIAVMELGKRLLMRRQQVL